MSSRWLDLEHVHADARTHAVPAVYSGLCVAVSSCGERNRHEAAPRAPAVPLTPRLSASLPPLTDLHAPPCACSPVQYLHRLKFWIPPTPELIAQILPPQHKRAKATTVNEKVCASCRVTTALLSMTRLSSLRRPGLQITQKVDNVFKNAAVVVDAAELSIIAGRRPGASAMQWPQLFMYDQVRVRCAVHTPTRCPSLWHRKLGIVSFILLSCCGAYISCLRLSNGLFTVRVTPVPDRHRRYAVRVLGGLGTRHCHGSQTHITP
jgi:hypothetical protein